MQSGRARERHGAGGARGWIRRPKAARNRNHRAVASYRAHALFAPCSATKEATVKSLIASLAVPLALSVAGAAYGGEAASAPPPQTRYQLTNLSSLGGSASAGNSVNDIGWVAGESNLAGNSYVHASLWSDGTQLDLGALGGPNANSAVLWPVKNNIGLVSGVAQTATPDTLGENWSCSAFFPQATAVGPTCVGFAWTRAGGMQPLATLGGPNGFATGANDRGEIVGWAENTVHDPTCTPPQVLQFEAVVWGPDGEVKQQLPPLGKDTSTAATAINDRGQVVGISGLCDQAVGRFTARHAVLWENGTVYNLGDLGAHSWNTPMAINQRGDVVGFAGKRGTNPDSPILLAFLWTKSGGMQNLGTLDGDVTSQALGINDRGQVVGTSCNASNACRAFLWENGQMIDLNQRIGNSYTSQLVDAQDINDLGVITGAAFDAASGDVLTFVATPLPGMR
jgi:probable HAF family extracellular repeat protein